MKIHELDATGVADALSRGTLSSVEVVEALLSRAADINDELNAIVVPFEDALLQARQADRERARGNIAGPLHGVPITIKESLDVAGYDSTMGFESRVGKPAAHDAVVVAAARRAGAILLGKTNVPQTLLSPLETTNYIWGATPNPWNLARAAGGSSGGEAAALAAGLSPAGIGTDVGGSIRLPAAFCGVAGLKPTAHRWSNRGACSVVKGQEFVTAQTGPMARTVRDLALMMRALDPVAQSQFDPKVPPLPYSSETPELSSLRVGYYVTDGFLEPSPAIGRAVREAKDALETAGVTVVPFEPPNVEQLLELHFAALSADGTKTLLEVLGRDRLIETLRMTRSAARIPTPLRRMLAGGLELMGEDRVGRVLRNISEKDVATYWRLTALRDHFMRVEQSAWRELGIDALLCPIQATPAVQHGMGKDFILSFCYAARYNMLNLPAGTVPVGRVQAEESKRVLVRDRIDRRAAAVEEGSEGLPVAVQIVGRPYHEATVLALMEAVAATCRERLGYPKTPIRPERPQA